MQLVSLHSFPKVTLLMWFPGIETPTVRRDDVMPRRFRGIETPGDDVLYGRPSLPESVRYSKMKDAALSVFVFFPLHGCP